MAYGIKSGLTMAKNFTRVSSCKKSWQCIGTTKTELPMSRHHLQRQRDSKSLSKTWLYKEDRSRSLA
ncbi:hypothetical protein AOLI_G00123270 [Acnodon oligacanthus]